MKMMIKIWVVDQNKFAHDADGELALFNTESAAIRWLNDPDELKDEYLKSNFEFHDHFYMDKTGYDYQ
jgi:hypothetical protein